MKVVEVSLHPMHDGEKVQGTFVVEKRRGDKWEMQKRFVEESGRSSRRIFLEEDERLVIEAEADIETVIDANQMMAMQRRRDLPARALTPQDEEEPHRVLQYKR